MTTNLIPSDVSKPTSLSQVSYFGPPPLIDGENTEAYDEMLLRVSSAVGPCDFLEEIWVRDVVDLTWEIHRWRQLKAHLISNGVADLVIFKLEKVVKTIQDVHELVALWKARDPGAISRVKEYLALTGDTLEAITAKVVCDKIGYFRRVEDITTKAEWRRRRRFYLAVLIERLTFAPRYDISLLRNRASHVSPHAIHARADRSPMRRLVPAEPFCAR